MIKNTSWPLLSYGAQGCPTVLFLHGFLGDKGDWKPTLQALGTTFWCLAPDLPGHGQNNQPLPEKPLSFAWLAQELDQLLAEIGISQFHLVGYSMGGRLGLYFSAQYPQRLLSLTLESTSPGLRGEAERQVRRLEDARRATQITADGLPAFIESWYQMPLFASLQRDPTLLKKIKRRRKQNNPQAIARIIAELSPGVQPPLWGYLSKIAHPVLLLAGKDDLKYYQMVTQMAEEIPDARIAIAPGAGHNIHIETPEWFIQTLKAFLDDAQEHKIG